MYITLVIVKPGGSITFLHLKYSFFIFIIIIKLGEIMINSKWQRD